MDTEGQLKFWGSKKIYMQISGGTWGGELVSLTPKLFKDQL